MALTLFLHNASKPSLPSFSRRLLNASLRRISLSARFSAPLLPGRTSRRSSQSGIELSKRSTSAVPRKPVAPVIAIRFPDKFCFIIIIIYQLVS